MEKIMLRRAIRAIVLTAGLALVVLAVVLATPLLRGGDAVTGLRTLVAERVGNVQDTASHGGLAALNERTRASSGCAGILCRQQTTGGEVVVGIAEAMRNSRSSGTLATGGARFVTPPKR